MIRTLDCVRGAALAVLLLLPAGVRAEDAPVWSFKPEKGFVDDPLALSAGDARLAFVHTDSATFTTLVVVSTTGGFKVEREIPVGEPAIAARHLVFTPDGKRLVLTWMDGYKGTHGAAVFEVESGKMLKKFGPAAGAELVRVGTEQVLALLDVKDGAGGKKPHTVTLVRTGDLKPMKVTKIVLESDGTVAKPPSRLLYWEPGYVSFLGMMKGAYDKKRDVRLPEKAARFDLVQGKVVWSEEPQQLMEWTQATNMRPEHPLQLRFLHVSDDRTTLFHVDRNNVLGRVTTPVDWKLYEPASLQQRESWDGERFFFSMTIDPVNPEALKRKKADPERMDLYELGADLKPVPLGQVLTDKRKFTWRVGETHFAYLMKLKGFARGGKELRLYKKKL